VSAPAPRAGRHAARRTGGGRARAPTVRTDPLLVNSVSKAFRVLAAFDGTNASMGLTQIAEAAGLDRSAAQRFTHTLVKLGFLRKRPETKQFELTAKTLELACSYLRVNGLVQRATPHLLHLSKVTEETINLTLLDDTDVIFVSRFMSRHVLANNVILGTRLPAYCTAAGIAMLSRLERGEARDVLSRSSLRAFTPHTTWRLADLIHKLTVSEARGYATAFEEYYNGDLSVAAAVLDRRRQPVGAISISVSRDRYTPEQAEERFAPLVVAAALSASGV
jgi:DNA-binding IclR family transcriptional regulator